MYQYGNQKLRFHSIRAEVNEDKTILLTWELRTRNIPLQPHPLPIITASGKLTDNCWAKPEVGWKKYEIIDKKTGVIVHFDYNDIIHKMIDIKVKGIQ
jgi:hypothetical protein